MILSKNQRDDLKQKIFFLKTLKKVAPQEIEEINSVIEDINQLLSPKTKTYATVYETIKQANDSISKDYPYCQLISALWPDINSPQVKPFSTTFTKEQMIDLTFDFFNSTSQKTSNLFRTIYKKDYQQMYIGTLTKDSMYPGYTFYQPYFKKNYISVYRAGKYPDITTLVHEAGHAIQNVVNYSPATPPVLTEVVSMFFEIASQEYFHSQGIKDNNIGNYNRFEGLNYYIICFKKMIYVFNYLCYVFRNPACFDYPELIKGELDKIYSEDELKSFFIDTPYDRYIYIIGAIIACNLYTIYVQDKKAALSILYYFVNMDQSNHNNLYHFLYMHGLLNPQGYMAYQDTVRKRTL